MTKNISSAMNKTQKPQGIVDWEFVTPQKAEEWIGLNIENRSLSVSLVQQYRGALERGEWDANTATIMFDEDGNLTDGQHRLKAVTSAKIGYWTLVGRNFPRKVRETVDTGRKRTPGDVLAMHGLGSYSYAALAAGVRMVLNYKSATGKALDSHRKKTNQQIINFIESNPDILDVFKKAERARGKEKINLTSTVLVATYWLLYEVDPLATEEFFTKLESGANLESSDPILGLRNRINAEKGRRDSYVSSDEWLAFVIKTWNLWRAGQPKKTLVFRFNESLPIPE